MNDADWLRKHLRGKVQRARSKLPQGPGPAESQDKALPDRVKGRLHKLVDRVGRRPKAPESD